jgi:protein-tyrosine phosphatase
VGDVWQPDAAGVLRLPSGRLVRGRALSRALPVGQLPQFAVYLLGDPPEETPWETRWLHWRDMWLPSDPAGLRETLVEALRRSADERVEFACKGGIGRTGTALACLAILDGVPARDAVRYVRAHYTRRAVEAPWQGWFVRRFR